LLNGFLWGYHAMDDQGIAIDAPAGIVGHTPSASRNAFAAALDRAYFEGWHWTSHEGSVSRSRWALARPTAPSFLT
jgi:hypothetical protein